MHPPSPRGSPLLRTPRATRSRGTGFPGQATRYKSNKAWKSRCQGLKTPHSRYTHRQTAEVQGSALGAMCSSRSTVASCTININNPLRNDPPTTRLRSLWQHEASVRPTTSRVAAVSTISADARQAVHGDSRGWLACRVAWCCVVTSLADGVRVSVLAARWHVVRGGGRLSSAPGTRLGRGHFPVANAGSGSGGRRRAACVGVGPRGC